ncbi:MAG: gliding motility-associated C-terminal domain-containing protein [Flavobacteriales bacterium]|nr:gliding motility-associated C-terminal domain-containing protein [Flavobacteriales bacterium]
MKDKMNHLFRERFQGHEAPVDPATWQVIEARLLTSAPASDSANDLFKDRFQQHEVNVDPGVWQGISSQLGHGAAGGGLLGGYGWVAAGLAGVVAVGALVFALNQGDGDAALAKQEPAKTTATQPESSIPDREAIVANEGSSGPATIDGNPDTGSNPTRLTSTSTKQTPELVATNPADLNLALGAVQPSTGDTDPELVELIITDLSEQVIKEVEAGQRTASPDGVEDATTETASEQESTVPPAESAAEEQPVKLIMPNVFTPNGDGTNDTYRIEPKNGFASTLVRVYSMKSNQLVFSSTGLDQEWTGANCEDGMYMVAVEAITLDGRVISEGKVVWLNRNSMN